MSALRDRTATGLGRASVRIVFVAAGAEAVMALALALTPNSSEGWIGAALFAVLYAIPLLALSVLLVTSRSEMQSAAAVLGCLLALFYVAVLGLNWTGYAPGWEAIRAVLVSAVAVTGCAASVWAGLAARAGRNRVRAASGRAGGARRPGPRR